MSLEIFFTEKRIRRRRRGGGDEYSPAANPLHNDDGDKHCLIAVFVRPHSDGGFGSLVVVF